MQKGPVNATLGRLNWVICAYGLWPANTGVRVEGCTTLGSHTALGCSGTRCHSSSGVITNLICMQF